MKEQFKKLVIKGSSILIIILVLLMILCFTLCHVLVRQSMISDYNRIVGRAYSESEQMAEVLAEYLYNDDFSKEDILSGQQAMQKFGYTADGMTYAKTYDMRIYMIFYALICCIFIVLILVIKYYKKREMLAIEEEKEVVRENILYSNLGEKQFLEKKNSQTQNYIENVAHQVRTPLTNIMLNINMVYDEQTEENKAILDECNYHAERINRLMESLMKIGRLEAGKIVFEKNNDNLKVMLERLINSYKGEKRIIFKGEDVYLSVDYDWIYEAVKCLVDNTLENIGEENKVYVTLRQGENKAVIIIEDDGYGFNEEDIPYLFERFYSSKDIHATKHYGIGLNLAKLIIEGHYGKITAYNRKNGGAGFCIELPQYKLK